MRLFLFLLCGLLSCASTVRAQETAEETNPYDVFAGVPAPLAAALKNFTADANRWAYTQRREEYDRDGKLERVTVARYDPSQHYDVQWTLLERDGQKPTDSQQKSYQKRRAKQQKDRKSLGELLKLREAVLSFQSSKELVYEVPLKLDDEKRFPPEKFQVFVTVDRATQTLRLLDVKLRDKLRVLGIASIKNADARIEFQVVSPEHGPVVAAISAGGVASVMFIPVGGRTEAVRTDYKRVTPYDERFQVKLGPLKAIDF